MNEQTLERYGHALVDQTAQFAATARRAAADAPVPTCPEWTRSISDELDDNLQASGELGLLTHWVENSAHQAD